jgi:D-serine deaminase-like pyridoxal phosphate-dependent protein
VLLTNQVVGVRKLSRFAELLARYEEGGEALQIGFLVDDADNVAAIRSALKAAGVTVPVLVFVELDVGQRRCGLADAEAAAQLAFNINSAGGLLVFGGLHAYNGSNQHAGEGAGPGSTRAHTVSQVVLPFVQATIDAMAQLGMAAPKCVTGGGTGSFELEASSGVYTEVHITL